MIVVLFKAQADACAISSFYIQGIIDADFII